MSIERLVPSEKDLERIEHSISALREEHHIINEIIREQIFSIIEKECKVLYYPFDDKDVKACYLPRVDYRGTAMNFILINTNQPLAEQVFACAHELAHILKVASSGGETLTDPPAECSSHDYQEAVADRFSAELLMPADIFKNYAEKKIKEKVNSLETVFSLMDVFLTSFKAVTYRLEEVGLMPSATRALYIKIADEEPEILKTLQKKYGLCEQNNLVSNRKSFGDFIEMVEELYDAELINENKYSNLLKRFGLTPRMEQQKEIEQILNANPDSALVAKAPDESEGGGNLHE